MDTISDINHEALWEEAKDLGDDLVDAGGDPDKVAEAVATFLDALIPLDVLVPGLPGMILEMGDGPAFKQIVGALVDLFKVDPEKRRMRREARQAKRHARRAKRNRG